MTTQNFDLNKIRNLSPNDARKYITDYFVPLSNGNHAMLHNGVFCVKEDQEIKRTYFNRIPRELQNYYFKEYLEIKTITFDVNKPVFFDDYINLCPKMKYCSKEPYTLSEDIKPKLNFFLDYLKNILCSGNQDCYEFLLRWLANTIRGNKNNSCLYLKGPQGTGKSSLFQFLCNHVIGPNLCLETGSDPIRTKFNEILGGKLLVCLEELENFSKAEWESISSTMKRMITSSFITLQNKCTKSYESVNINNYILCSNNDAIKDDDGRRYFILDISTDKIHDKNYYKTLYEDCYNDEVGKAFFYHLLSINLDNYNAQAFPITLSKLDSISKRLDVVYKFIKDEYILNNNPINCSAMELYDEFKFNHPTSKMSKEDFHKKLLEVGIARTKVNGRLHYNISHQELLTKAKAGSWIHELDEYIPPVVEEPVQPPPKVSKSKSKSVSNKRLEIDFEDT